MFTDQQRQIFGPYLRGDGTEVMADPLRVRRKLKALLDGDPKKAVEQARDPTIPVLADKAMDRVLAAAVEALDLVAFDPATGEGLDEGQVIAVLNEYIAWEEATALFFGQTPTTQPFTESASSNGETPGPTTEPASAST